MAYPFVVGPVVGDEAELPAMFAVRQHFDVLPAVDALAALREEWPRAKAAGCLAHLPAAPAVVVDPALRRLPFDAAGNLVSPFTGA